MDDTTLDTMLDTKEAYDYLGITPKAFKSLQLRWWTYPGQTERLYRKTNLDAAKHKIDRQLSFLEVWT